MLFNSPEFGCFFLFVLSVYFFLPRRGQNLFLLIASYYFYSCWNWKFLFLILFSTGVDFYCGKKIAAATTQPQRKFYLCLNLFSSLSILVIFKYTNFFIQSFNIFLNQLGISMLPAFTWILPVGISFYTFQSMTYAIDIYRKQIQPEKNLLKFALFVAFFPQLVAGPIERAGRLLPQFSKKAHFDSEKLRDGLLLIGWGLFKKVAIADRLAFFINPVFTDPASFDAVSYWLAAFFFAFQIYCDFSGYSDIAIGTAKILGVDLMQNFHLPYFSRSIPEFWKRWHISLSTWFRDYLYIPLGGNRCSKNRWLFNVMLTFLISGLWHGANWTFVLWGFLHGFYYAITVLFESFWKILSDFLKKVFTAPGLRCLQILFTFFLVLISWIAFRSENLLDAFYIYSHLFSFGNADATFSWQKFVYMNQPAAEFWKALALIAFLLIVQSSQTKITWRRFILRQEWLVRWSCYYFLIYGILALGIFNRSAFIYFQF